MESPNAALSREPREFLKQEQQFMRQIMFVADQAFVERTQIPGVSEARHGEQAEDGFIRPLPWEYLVREAAE
jgi:hypothetical protein